MHTHVRIYVYMQMYTFVSNCKSCFLSRCRAAEKKCERSCSPANASHMLHGMHQFLMLFHPPSLNLGQSLP